MSAGANDQSGSRDGLRSLTVVGLSIVMWGALWGDLSVANVLWGAVIGVVILWLVPVAHRDHRLPVRVLPLVKFVGYFAWALVRASAVVAWEVVTPGSSIREGIVAVPLQSTSPGLMTLMANAISLTPGTLTIETRRDPPTLYVHVLHVKSVDDVRADIRQLESVVMAAFAHEPSERAARERGGTP